MKVDQPNSEDLAGPKVGVTVVMTTFPAHTLLHNLRTELKPTRQMSLPQRKSLFVGAIALST